MISLSDPEGAHPLVVGVQWLQAAMLGTVATVIAVIAVAGVGALMLTGRLDWRRGATIVLGCFVLFGSARIAIGITGAPNGTNVEYTSPSPNETPVVKRVPVQPSSPGFDPYAGAAPARMSRPIN